MLRKTSDSEAKGTTVPAPQDTTSPSPYPHWMLREIHEQPQTLAATLEQYVTNATFRADRCAPLLDWLQNTREVVLTASGSSRHAGMVGELLIEDHSGIAVDVEYASEYLYRAEQSLKSASVLVVSQSGETVDTLLALRKADTMGCASMAITNVPDSSMARAANVSFPTAAGKERAIPATKSFTAQLLNLYLLSLLAAHQRNTIDAATLTATLAELERLPASIASQLPRWESSVRDVAQALRDKKSFLFVGRGVHYPIARESALKLKESAYLHAEGYPSGELKHGPNALLSDSTPLVMLATVDHANPESMKRYDKVLQLMRDMRQQGATILAIANTGDLDVPTLATHTVFVDGTSDALLTIAEVIPMQLFAYFMSLQNGIDVDRPRNLSKAVLAE